MRLLEQLFLALRNVLARVSAMLIRFRQHHRDTALVLIVLLCVPIFAAAQPLIQSINPSQGPIAGNTQVTLAGSGFTGTALMIDGTAVTPSSASDTQIVFQTPAHDNGIVTLKLSGSGPTAYGEFLYLPPRLQDLPPGYITTVAGIGLFTGLYRPATQAEIKPQGSPAFDRQGNLYIPEPNNNRVIRVRLDGIVEPFAGSGIPDYLSASGIGDGGPATEASLTFPRGVTTDAAGNVYVTEFKHRIRKVDAHTGIITTIAGDGTAGFSGDGGPAVQARLNDVTHITGDGNGTLFFIDFDDASSVARIRKIMPDGIISTIAGMGPEGYSGDGGPATQAQFNLIMGDNGSLALDPQGNLFIVDFGNRRIRRIDGRTGIITTVFGPAYVTSIACDSVGNIYFDNNLRIKKMSPSGEILAAYGNGQMGGYGEDGAQATDSVVNGQPGAVDALGNIIFLENMQRVRRINVATGKLETVAGIKARTIGESGPALATTLQSANSGDLAFLPSGELLVGDSGHNMLRKIDANGAISTYGQGGSPGLPAGKGWEEITFPIAVKTAPSGQIFVADTRNVFRVDATGQVIRIAGTGQGQYGYTGDGGPATEALLCQPWDIALDGAGNLFIADTNNNRIRRVDARTGFITTVAGSGPVNGFEHYGTDGQGSFSGDGGPAMQATLNTPYGVAVDAQGNLFIEDSGNQRIRKVDAKGIITTFVANNASGTKLAFDGSGNLYGVFNAGFVRFDSTGKNTPVAGQWPPGFSGDGGPALQARTRTVAQAVGIAIDAEGNFFFIDNGNFRVRAIRYGAVMAAPGSTVAASGGSTQMTPTGTTFPSALQITLNSPEGTPANGIRVDFAAPTSGASCTFAGGSSTFSILTDINGHASATCTANAQTGAYSVTATPLALGRSASFSFTNANTVIITGVGSVTIYPSGVSCGATCASPLVEGTSVTISASPGDDQSFLGWSGDCSGNASTCSFTASSNPSVSAAFTGIALNLAAGWNLVGNSYKEPITVARSFNDATKVTTIWKWVTVGTTPEIIYPTWAFYSPAQSDGGKAYAISKGYDFLTAINGGDGFWVNAKSAFTALLPAVTAVSSTSYQGLSSGWHLIATGNSETPSTFNTNLSTIPPAAGVVPANLLTLWTWDTSQSKWYFYAPNLEAKSGTVFADYITSRGYLNFTTANKTLGAGVGFWVYMQ